MVTGRERVKKGRREGERKERWKGERKVLGQREMKRGVSVSKFWVG